MHSTRPHRVFLEGQLALPQARFDPPDRRLWSLAMPLPAFAGRDGGDETLSWRAKPDSSCPVRNDETTSTPPDMCPGSSPQPHSGPAEETRRSGRDPSGAAGPQPRSFRLERLDEKTNPAPTNVFRRMEGSGGLEWQSQAAAPTCCGVRSIKTCGDATHDYRAKTAVRGTIRSGDVSVSSQFQNAELLGQETAIALFDGFFGPLINVRVPNWAVIGGRGGNATERVVGTMSVQESGAQTLTLRILATAFGLPVRGDEDPLHGATTDVIDPGFDSPQTRSEGIPLNSRHSGITGLSGDVEDGLAKAVSVDQRESDGAVRRINSDYLIMHEAVVGISIRKIYECIVYSSGDNGRVVNDAVDEHQWAIVLIADRARLRDARWEGLLLRASHNMAVRTEVHEAGVEEKRPVGAARGGASGIACVM